MFFVCHIYRWSRSSNSGKNGGGTAEGEEKDRETTFRARFDLENAAPGGVNVQVGEGGHHNGGDGDGGAVFVVAVTSVDQAWGAQVEKGWPDVGPQVRHIFPLQHNNVRPTRALPIGGQQQLNNLVGSGVSTFV